MNPTRRTVFKAGAVVGAALLGGFALGRAKGHVPDHLRPPGAGAGSDFLAACIRCGLCVAACPTQILSLTGARAGLAWGTPQLVARAKPCNLCQGQSEMKCIAVCPTGALQPLDSRADVRMGVAQIDQDICLPWQGVSCKACWHACPFPNEAITFDRQGFPVVVEDKCVGCGLCEHACLTADPAIRIQARSLLDREVRQVSSG